MSKDPNKTLITFFFPYLAILVALIFLATGLFLVIFSNVSSDSSETNYEKLITVKNFQSFHTVNPLYIDTKNRYPTCEGKWAIPVQMVYRESHCDNDAVLLENFNDINVSGPYLLASFVFDEYALCNNKPDLLSTSSLEIPIKTQHIVASWAWNGGYGQYIDSNTVDCKWVCDKPTPGAGAWRWDAFYAEKIDKCQTNLLPT